ncbi:hypothetical protein UFOVP25_43 [uncultured Caudovirales phage]|uniref:Uncharacterized protein n=1 Tax=uncultured Caudovirales phage TaxID=2100421 RepID=A0A6J5KLB1_9CAUD|nr:hypothetical protein UFOVP25_43 [uncultured Caudovirales phage]
MATETLKIVITADNKGALTSLQQTAAETDKFKLSLGDLNTRLSLLKERLNQATEPARITKLGAEIKLVTSQIESQKSAFAALGAETEKAASGMAGGLNKAFSGLRMIANILPGIGLAGMFGLAFEGLGKLVEEMGLFSNKITESEKKLSDYNEVNKKANKDAGEQIATLKTLYSIATDVNASMDTRNKAAKELQDLFPKTYGNLSLEVIKIGEAKDATDALTKSIIEQARAKAALAKISELESQRLDIEDKKRKIDNATFNESKRIKGTSTDVVFGGGTGGIGGGGGVTLSVQDQQNRILERKLNALKPLDAELANINEREKALTSIIGAQNIVQEIAIENEQKLSKTTKEKISPLERLKDTYKADTEALVNMLMYGGMSLDEFQKKIGELNVRTLQNFFKDGGKAASEFGQELIKLQPKFNEFGQIIGRGDLIQRDKKLPTQQGMINKILPEGGGIQKEQLNAGNGLDKINAALAQTQQIMSVVGPQIDNLFTAMENGANLGQALGDMFKKLAEDIAKAAIKALIFQVILSAVSGGTANAAGGGFGSIFKKMLGFDKGGVSTGPQGGHMELLHGTEAILTPAQMSGLVRNSMNAGAVTSMGNNSQQQGSQQGEFTLRGNDLVLALQRSNVALNLRRGN